MRKRWRGREGNKREEKGKRKRRRTGGRKITRENG